MASHRTIKTPPHREGVKSKKGTCVFEQFDYEKLEIKVEEKKPMSTLDMFFEKNNSGCEDYGIDKRKEADRDFSWCEWNDD